MWVFGYGSLMCGGWETKYGCRRRAIAEVRGYRRAFNKPSTKNWGTKKHPAPTLNLEVASGGSCVGAAFEFEDSNRRDVLTYLRDREGSGFELREGVEIFLKDGTEERAVVPICVDNALLISESLAVRAAMARVASGEKGNGVAYVEKVVKALAACQIDDPIVTAFWGAVSSGYSPSGR